MCDCSEKIKKLTIKKVAEHNIPFKCLECGALEIPRIQKVLRDLVFVWPLKIPFAKEESTIILPETLDDLSAGLRIRQGIVVACGRGYYRKDGAFVPMPVEVGDMILFDIGMPFYIDLKAQDGLEYRVRLMNFLDIFGILS